MTTPTGPQAQEAALSELLALSTEMRERKVSHGKHTSPTLVAWSDRINALCATLATPARVVSDAEVSRALNRWFGDMFATEAADQIPEHMERMRAALSTLQSGAEGKDSIDPLAVALCRISTLADRWEERALEVDSYADSAEDRMVSVCLNGAAKELRTALQPGQGEGS